MVLTALGLGLIGSSAFGQLNPPDELDGGGRTAYENVRPGQVAQNRPGRMVQDGLAQQRQFNRGLNLTVQVTEGEEIPTPYQEFLAESITTLFDQVVFLIEAFQDRLNRRAGRPSSLQIPSSFLER